MIEGPYTDEELGLLENAYNPTTDVLNKKVKLMRKILEYELESNNIVREHFNQYGFDPSEIKSLDDLALIPPVTTDIFKKYLPNRQESPLPRKLLLVPESEIKFYESSSTSGNPSLIGFTENDVKMVQRTYMDGILEGIGVNASDTHLLALAPSPEMVPHMQASIIWGEVRRVMGDLIFVLRPDPKNPIDIETLVSEISKAEAQEYTIVVAGNAPLLYSSIRGINEKTGKRWNLGDLGWIHPAAGGWDGKKGRIDMPPIVKEEFVKEMKRVTGVSSYHVNDGFGTTESKAFFFAHWSEKHKDFLFHTPDGYCSVFVRRPEDYEIVEPGEQGLLNIVTPLTFKGTALTGSVVLDDYVELVSDNCEVCEKKVTLWKHIKRTAKSEKAGCGAVDLDRLSELAKKRGE